jgi:hypothetical protein
LTTPRVQVPRHVVRLVTWLVAPLIVDYFTDVACSFASARHAACRMTHCRLFRLAQARHRLLRLHCASRCLGSSRDSSSTTSTTPRVRVPQHVAQLVVDYFASAVRLGASARRAASCQLLRLRRRSRCLGMSRGSSRGASHCSSSTTPPTPRVHVPRLVARLVMQLVTLIVADYFAYAARPGASARRATCHAARRASRHRLLRLRHASGCHGTSRGSSRGSSSTTSTMLRVRVPRQVARLVAPFVADYFAYAARPGASARRAARHAARRRLLHLLRVSGCLSTLRGSSRRSSSTTPCAATLSCSHTSSTSATSCVVTTCLAAIVDLLRVRRTLPRRRLLVASRRPFISTSLEN